MATPITVEVVGGACDGTKFQRSQLHIVNNTFTCGGDLYTLTPISATLERANVEAVGVKGLPASVTGSPTDLNKAWSRFMHTLAFYVPQQLTRQRVARNRIRKAVR